MNTILNKKIISQKVFSYQKNDVALSFQLTDDLNYLKDFSDLLTEAKKDVEQVIKSKK